LQYKEFYDIKAANIKMTMAASSKLQKAGYSVNVILDNSTNFNINIVDKKEEETEIIEHSVKHAYNTFHILF
jgi:glutathione synthase/RimK-type ligase-like ATP-grasp enzyme